jgi:hypothetical protein
MAAWLISRLGPRGVCGTEDTGDFRKAVVNRLPFPSIYRIHTASAHIAYCDWAVRFTAIVAINAFCSRDDSEKKFLFIFTTELLEPSYCALMSNRPRTLRDLPSRPMTRPPKLLERKVRFALLSQSLPQWQPSALANIEHYCDRRKTQK